MNVLFKNISAKVTIAVFLLMCLYINTTYATRNILNEDSDRFRYSVNSGEHQDANSNADYNETVHEPIASAHVLPKTPAPMIIVPDFLQDIRDKFEQQVRMCPVGLPLSKMCEFCAKDWKQLLSYPMCCENEDGIRDQCRDLAKSKGQRLD